LRPNKVNAAVLVKLKVRAGVVVGVATLVVKSGERFPALKLVTVPLPPPPQPELNAVEQLVVQWSCPAQSM
jgi:hypothetical protein